MTGVQTCALPILGFRLWQTLSEALAQKVSKSNIKAVLGRYARHRQQQAQTAVLPLAPTSLALEFPSGPVPLSSSLYIERPPIESQAFADVLKPGSLIRIKDRKRVV